eukprot:3573283-Pyramimonas_sp.AAC.1
MSCRGFWPTTPRFDTPTTSRSPSINAFPSTPPRGAERYAIRLQGTARRRGRRRDTASKTSRTHAN